MLKLYKASLWQFVVNLIDIYLLPTDLIDSAATFCSEDSRRKYCPDFKGQRRKR